MPIYYRFDGEKGQGEVYSDSILIQTPEPDFSMPFNVNAISHALWGILFCNTVFALYNVDDYKEKPEEESCDQKKVEEDKGM